MLKIMPAYSTRVTAQDPIVDSRFLAVLSQQLSTLTTQVRNNLRPEDPLKCYDIRILSPDVDPGAGAVSHIIFTCNEDKDDPENYFCISTTCIIDDDG